MKRHKGTQKYRFAQLVTMMQSIGSECAPDTPAFVELANAIRTLPADQMSKVFPLDERVNITHGNKQIGVYALYVVPLLTDNVTILEMLIKQGLNIETLTLEGSFLLNAAIIHGADRCANRLIELGASCTQKDKLTHSAVILTCIYNRYALLRKILETKDINIQKQLIDGCIAPAIAQKGLVEPLTLIVEYLTKNGVNLTHFDFSYVFSSLLMQEFYRVEPVGFFEKISTRFAGTQQMMALNNFSLRSQHFDVLSFLIRKGILSPFKIDGLEPFEYFELEHYKMFQSLPLVRMRFMELFLRLGTGFDPKAVKEGGYLKRNPIYKVPENAEFCVVGKRPDESTVRCYTVQDLDAALKSDVIFEYEALWFACIESTLSEALKSQICALLKARYPQLANLNIVKKELTVCIEDFQWPPSQGIEPITSNEIGLKTSFKKVESTNINFMNIWSGVDGLGYTLTKSRHAYYAAICRVGHVLVNAEKGLVSRYVTDYVIVVQQFLAIYADLDSSPSLLNFVKAVRKHLLKLNLINTPAGLELQKIYLIESFAMALYQFQSGNTVEAEYLALALYNDPTYSKLLPENRYNIDLLLLDCFLERDRKDVVSQTLSRCFSAMKEADAVYDDFFDTFVRAATNLLQEEAFNQYEQQMLNFQALISRMKESLNITQQDFKRRNPKAPISKFEEIRAATVLGIAQAARIEGLLKEEFRTICRQRIDQTIAQVIKSTRTDLFNQSEKPTQIICRIPSQAMMNNLVMQLKDYNVLASQQEEKICVPLDSFSLLKCDVQERFLKRMYSASLTPLVKNEKMAAAHIDNIVKGVQDLHLRQKPKKNKNKEEVLSDELPSLVEAPSVIDERAEIEKHIAIPEGYSKPIKILNTSQGKANDNCLFLIIKNELVPQFKSALTNRGGETAMNPNEPWTTQLLPKRSRGPNGVKLWLALNPKTSKATLAAKVKSVSAGDARAWSQAGYKNYLVGKKKVTVFHIDAAVDHAEIRRLKVD